MRAQGGYDIEVPIELSQVQGQSLVAPLQPIESYWGYGSEEPGWARILLRDPLSTRQQHRWIVLLDALATGINMSMEDAPGVDPIDDVRLWSVDAGRVALQLWSEQDGVSLFMAPRGGVERFLRKTERFPHPR